MTICFGACLFHLLYWDFGALFSIGIVSFSFENNFFLGSWFKKLFIWLHGVLVVAHRIFKCSRWTLSCGIWDLVPWPGIKSGPPALGPSHWITMEEPQKFLYQATTRFVIEKLLNVSGGFFFFSYPHLGFSGPLEKNFLLSQGGWEGRGVVPGSRHPGGKRGEGLGLSLWSTDLPSTPQLSTLHLFPALQTLFEIPEYGSLRSSSICSKAVDRVVWLCFGCAGCLLLLSGCGGRGATPVVQGLLIVVVSLVAEHRL